MAFRPANLHVLAYAHGFTLWHVATDDALDAVAGEGYFASAGDLFRSGDLILANVGEGKDPAFALLHVADAGKGRVTVRDLLPPPCGSAFGPQLPAESPEPPPAGRERPPACRSDTAGKSGRGPGPEPPP